MEDIDFLQQLEFSICNGVDAFRSFIERQLENGLPDDRFEALIGYLEDLPEREAALSAQLSTIIMDLFATSDDPSRVGLVWHFVILSNLYKLEPATLIKNLNRALHFCAQEPVAYGSGHMICQNTWTTVDIEVIGEDSLLLIDKAIIDYYRAINEIPETLKFIFHAVNVFSRQGAFQSAYRMLDDAERMVVDADRPDLHIEVMLALAGVCVEENDNEYALEVYDKAFEALREADEIIPEHQRFNYATLNMRLRHTEKALGIFTELAKTVTTDQHQKLRIGYHIGICQKDLEKWDEALVTFRSLQMLAGDISTEIEKDLDLYLCEMLIDYEICYALILAKNDEANVALSYVKSAVGRIEVTMRFTIRPHFRRGIRTKYYSRILEVTDGIFLRVKVVDLLPILIYLKKNSQSDWLTILSWVSYMNDRSEVSDADKRRLNHIIERLHDHSGMVISNFKEKYDDPFEYASQIENIFSDEELATSKIPWQDLALLTDELTQRYQITPPFSFNGLEELQQVAVNKLNTGHILIFVFLTRSGFTLYSLNSERQARNVIEWYDIRSYPKALQEYRRGGSRASFKEVFLDATAYIDEILTPTWSELNIRDKNGIYIFPGLLDAFLPLAPSCLLNAGIMERTASGDFSIAQCPVMYPLQLTTGTFEKFVVLINEKDELPLFSEEAAVVKNLFKDTFILEVTEDKDIQDGMERINPADAVHFITHGTPISNYKDPYYARLSSDAFSLLTLKNFHTARHRLYLMNSCNAADTINGNLFNIQTTHEITGFITILMQNQKAMIIAPQWPLMDILAYVFSSLFYNDLAQHHDIKKAFSKAIYVLATADRPFFISLLEHIGDQHIKAQKIDLLQKVTDDLPFSNLFFYSAFNLYSLL
ncbi:CHAT domain-containing protein [Mucilaginibacter sp. dw_454]|uniref:CHAT domain-containing tetratricopeptide repeat protein n=1 Tax=Mucilaginibacter sp. dw_454 TaxID=2720079 RepID=UPI001BD45ED5|nr:CHAT domain-containing protein [Mucilaginibacter sp. dw_454]